MRAKYFFLINLFTFSVAFSQKIFVSHSLLLTTSFPKKFKFVVSYSANINSEIEISKKTAIIPFVDLKISLFHNYLGTSVLKHHNSFISSNLALSYGGFLSAEKRQTSTENNPAYIIQPIYSSIFANSFKNKYNYSLGCGTTYMFQKGRTPIITQKIGNVMLAIRNFYLTYYNDGGPVLSMFGDKEDRFWTGGVTLGYNVKNLHNFEINFDKFTGFTKNAFEVSGLLFNDTVIYKDIEETSYNSGKYSFKYFNRDSGLAGAVNFWNKKSDLQDWLHLNATNNPYHPKIEKFYFDIEMAKIYFK